MFCKRCGAKVQEHWNVCARCGQRLRYEQDSRERTELLTKASYVERADSIESEERDTGESSRNKTRMLLKILAVITVVCFFCPLYMFSCAGQELIEISGREMTFGFQYMDEELDGNLLFGFLALLPIFGAMLAFQNSKKLETQGKYEEIKELFCGNAVFAGGNLIVICYFTYVLKQAFYPKAVEVSFCPGMCVMIMTSLMSLLAGAYQTCQMELREKKTAKGKGAIIQECCGSIIGGCISIFLIVFLISYFTGAMDLDTSEEELLLKRPDVIEVSDFSREYLKV